MILIKQVEQPDEKTSITLKVMHSLPAWFSPPEYIEKKSITHRDYPFFAAYVENEPIGFIALKIHSKYTADIVNLGILEQYHRQGIGRKLLNSAEQYCMDNGYNRSEYLGDRKPPNGRDNLRKMIDDSLIVGRSFTKFLVALRKAGCAIKAGMQYSIKPPGSKKFFGLDTLGEEYSYDAIKEHLAGTRSAVKRSAADDSAKQKSAAYAASRNVPSLLIDIEKKMAEGKGGGYSHWATLFNLQRTSKTLLFIAQVICQNQQMCNTFIVLIELHENATFSNPDTIEIVIVVIIIVVAPNVFIFFVIVVHYFIENEIIFRIFERGRM